MIGDWRQLLLGAIGDASCEDRLRAVLDGADAEIAQLRQRIAYAEWSAEMGCEAPPERCECPGCSLARDRADSGDHGPVVDR